MHSSSIKLFMAGWLLFCLVTPLQCEPQSSYWPKYEIYNPIDPRLRSINLEAFHKKTLNPNVVKSPFTSMQYGPVYSQNAQTKSKYLRSNREERKIIAPKDEKRESFESSSELFEDQSTDRNWNDELLMEKISILDKYLSSHRSEKDIESNTIEEKIIPEETKRVVRQIRKERPGFFWTLARITFETFNDTRSAFKQITNIISNNIAPDSATQRPMTGASLTVSTVQPDESDLSNNLANANATVTTTLRPTTTTQKYVLTRGGLQSIIRRNLLGLVKLFNIEWRDALNQSEVNVRQFQKDLGNQVGTFLRDNPDAY